MNETEVLLAPHSVNRLSLAARVRSRLCWSGPQRIVFALLLVTYPYVAGAQGMSCQLAVATLQGYVQQVNAFANGEYYQGIPFRCGGNSMCMNQWLAQLNGWYTHQSALVNGWYQQIAQQCTSESSPPSLGGMGGNGEPHQIDEEPLEKLELDDEDKTVKIKIPSTPQGFQH